MRILEEEREDARESDQFAVQQMLGSRAWSVVQRRLIARRDAMGRRLATGQETALEKIRIEQGKWAILNALIEEPDLFFREES